MTEETLPPQDTTKAQGEALRRHANALLAALAAEDHGQAGEQYEHCLKQARTLFERKQSMQGTKSETRDMLGELVFSRLRQVFRELLDGADSKDEIRAAEWVLGSLFSAATLSDFAVALDRAMLERSSARDYSFAGRADFISIDEVLQLLQSGQHRGCLSLEKPDNKIDVFLDCGSVVFLDIHHLTRRVLPGASSMSYREIPLEALQDAEKKHAEDGRPILLTLIEGGHFAGLEPSSALRQLGCEVLYEFLREQDNNCNFSYRRLEEMPDFVGEQPMRLGITPILLEGHKCLDDWRSMLAVFPDPDQPVEPVEGMHGKISELQLGVQEIKLLALLDGQHSPRSMVSVMGLPLYDIYQMLVRFAVEGALVPTGGLETLGDASLSVEESMELAFEALDANDDDLERNNALDRVLGGSLEEDPKEDSAASSIDLGVLDRLDDGSGGD